MSSNVIFLELFQWLRCSINESTIVLLPRDKSRIVLYQLPLILSELMHVVLINVVYLTACQHDVALFE